MMMVVVMMTVCCPRAGVGIDIVHADTKPADQRILVWIACIYQSIMASVVDDAEKAITQKYRAFLRMLQPAARHCQYSTSTIELGNLRIY